MMKMFRTIFRGLAWMGLLLPASSIPGFAQPERPGVLIIYTYYSNTAPFQAIGSAFKNALARELGRPLTFYEDPLDIDRFSGPQLQAGYAELIQKRFAVHDIDLVVTIGGPAAQFVAQNREMIFPKIPILFVSVDERVASYKLLRRNGIIITQRISTVRWIDDILQIAPDTTNIVFAAGNSLLERNWTETERRELQSFKSRVNIKWLEYLSLDEMAKQVAMLPPHSFIILGLMIEDGAGITYSGNEGLQRLHGVANAPIYGIFQNQLGKGIIGGRLYQDQSLGAHAGSAAARILRGEPAANVSEQILPPSAPVYDHRELKRWGIREAQLPPGSSILYREPTLWQQYRWYILGVLLFALIETLLVAGLLTNLVRRRRAERSLRQSEQKYRTLHESMTDAFVSVDLTGHIREFNKAYQAMLGYAEEELCRLTYQEITPEKWREFEAQIVREQVLARGFSDVYEKEYRRKDGTVFSVELRTFLIKNEKGEPQGMWAIVRDITERRRAEEALRASEGRFRQVVELVSDFVWEVDADGLYIFTSPSVEKILGYTPDELIGKMHFYDLFAPDVREHMKETAFQTFAARERFQAFPNTNISKTGKVVHLETSGMPILDSAGLLLGYRGTDTDVTAKRQAETEAQLHRQELAHFSRVASMGELTTSIAHEINQPLGAIRNNAEAALHLLRSGTPDLKELEEIFSDIVAADQRATDVIRSLRSMLKKGAGEHKPLLPSALIRDVLSIVRSEALTRGIRLELDLRSPLPPIKGDRIQLQQVILNLIVNALEAMDSSEQERTVHIRTREASGEVVLDVADSGPGIAADILDSIFEPFVTTKKDGLGMGLALSRSIVASHNGRIWAENNPGGGATFHIALPAVKP